MGCRNGLRFQASDSYQPGGHPEDHVHGPPLPLGAMGRRRTVRHAAQRLCGALQERLRAGLHGEARILLRFAPRDCGDALNEVEDAPGRAAFLGEHGLDDLGRLGLREAALLQEFGAVLVGARDDLLPCRADALDERRRRGVGKARQRRGRLMRKAVRGVFGMPDRDLLDVLDAPEIAVLADGAEIEARVAEFLGADFGVPAVEPRK